MTLGRCIRTEKVYSRAKDRHDMHRLVEEELDEDFEFPLMGPMEGEGPTLASLMSVDEEESTDDKRT